MLEEWHPSVREQKRQEVLEFEAFFRAQAVEDATTLVGRYGSDA